MGMHMSAMIDIDLGSFSRLCRHFHLPTPRVVEEPSHGVYAIVDQQTYLLYEAKHLELWEQIERGRPFWALTYHFLHAFTILRSTHMDDVLQANDDKAWKDLVFF